MRQWSLFLPVPLCALWIRVPQSSLPAPASGAHMVTASIIQKPTARNNLTYTGEPQELVTAPTAALLEPYRIVYALGDANGPTEEYTTSIPTATDAGT